MIRISALAILLTAAVLAAAGPVLAAGDLEHRVVDRSPAISKGTVGAGSASAQPTVMGSIRPGWYRSMEDRGVW